MPNHALKNQAAALALALAAHSAHAGLTITSMGQTASATASAEHSYTPSPGWVESRLVGPVDKKTDTSPTGALGTLTQQASAHAEGEGIIADANAQGRMDLVDNGITMSSSGSVRHVFPASVDVGPGAGAAIPTTTPSNDGKLSNFDAAGGTKRAMSSVVQNVSFHLSEGTQVQVDWSYTGTDPNFSYSKPDYWLLDAARTQVFGGRSLNSQSNPSALYDLPAGDYIFWVNDFTGVSRYTPGESTLSWQATASIRAVPEVSTLAMMGLGLAALSVVARRHGAAAQA